MCEIEVFVPRINPRGKDTNFASDTNAWNDYLDLGC